MAGTRLSANDLFEDAERVEAQLADGNTDWVGQLLVNMADEIRFIRMDLSMLVERIDSK